MGGKQSHVLVVEDTQELADLVKVGLETLGLQAVLCLNGQKALDYLESNPAPDLIILDINMPGMTGWQVLDAMKERFSHLLDIPVIVTTALSDPANRVIGKMQSSVVRYVTKPYDMTQLRQAVKETLSMS